MQNLPRAMMASIRRTVCGSNGNCGGSPSAVCPCHSRCAREVAATVAAIERLRQPKRPVSPKDVRQ